MSSGWICPRCGVSHAPHVSRCNCKPWPAGTIPASIPAYPAPSPTNDLAVMPVCGCRLGAPCLNVACPHAVRITY